MLVTVAMNQLHWNKQSAQHEKFVALNFEFFKNELDGSNIIVLKSIWGTFRQLSLFYLCLLQDSLILFLFVTMQTTMHCCYVPVLCEELTFRSQSVVGTILCFFTVFNDDIP